MSSITASNTSLLSIHDTMSLNTSNTSRSSLSTTPFTTPNTPTKNTATTKHHRLLYLTPLANAPRPNTLNHKSTHINHPTILPRALLPIHTYRILHTLNLPMGYPVDTMLATKPYSPVIAGRCARYINAPLRKHRGWRVVGEVGHEDLVCVREGLVVNVMLVLLERGGSSRSSSSALGGLVRKVKGWFSVNDCEEEEEDEGYESAAEERFGNHRTEAVRVPEAVIRDVERRKDERREPWIPFGY